MVWTKAYTALSSATPFPGVFTTDTVPARDAASSNAFADSDTAGPTIISSSPSLRYSTSNGSERPSTTALTPSASPCRSCGATTGTPIASASSRCSYQAELAAPSESTATCGVERTQRGGIACDNADSSAVPTDSGDCRPGQGCNMGNAAAAVRRLETAYPSPDG